MSFKVPQVCVLKWRVDDNTYLPLTERKRMITGMRDSVLLGTSFYRSSDIKTNGCEPNVIRNDTEPSGQSNIQRSIHYIAR